MLRHILHARNDAGIDGQRKAFQEKVDENLQKIRTSGEPERELVANGFANDLRKDQELLRRELRKAGLKTLFSKEGLVAVLMGIVAGTLSFGVGLAIGLTGETIGYHYQRQEVFNKHRSS